MNGDLILTCDAGTSSIKCSVFSAQGEALHTAALPYETAFPQPGWAQQAVEPIVGAMFSCIRTLLEQVSPSRIAVVGLSGTMNGCIPVDEAGRALHDNIIHSDARAAESLDEIRAVISERDFYRLTGNRIDFHATLPKILWLRRHCPDVYAHARYFLNTKDYLYARLTGRADCTDYSDAGLSLALDIRRRDWARDLLRELNLDENRMPRLLCGHDISGRVTAQAASLCGLLEGTPVAIGGGDGACAARGSGLYAPGSAYCCIGSSAWVSQLAEQPVDDPKARLFHYVDLDGRSILCCGTVQCGGDALNWGVRNLLGDQGPLPEALHRVEALARTVSPGAEGVYFLPTLMGERTPYWDPHTRGNLLGFTLYHTPAHIARALYQDVAYALSGCAGILGECGLPVKSLMLVGGGAKSALWADMLASMIGVPARIHAYPASATSMGAAIAAGVGAGLFEGYEQAAGIVRASSVHPVNPAWQAAYRPCQALYAQLYDRLSPLFEQIAAQ